jgi:RNA polymerase sigma-70 factor (ECF subfamily)
MTYSTTPIRTDEDEIKRVARADSRRGYELMVLRWRGPLVHHARGILHDAALAADAVQEVFIKAMREPRLFDEEFKTRAWLFRVTSNLCLNMVRDRRRRAAILEGTQPKTDTDANQLDLVLQEELREQLVGAMTHVSVAHREILLRRYYGDLSYNELADTLEVKLGTVMSRLSRARDALIEALAEDGLDELAA